MISLLYAALGFGLGFIVAAAVGTLVLWRWTSKTEPDAAETADDLPTSAVGMSGYSRSRVALGSFQGLPVAVSMPEKVEATDEGLAQPRYNVRVFLSKKAEATDEGMVLPHYNAKTFPTNYETVRKEDTSSAAPEDIPSAAELERLLAATHKNISD